MFINGFNNGDGFWQSPVNIALICVETNMTTFNQNIIKLFVF